MRPAIFQDENGQYRAGQGPVVGFVALKDTGKVNLYLNMPEVKAVFPSDVRFLWAAKPYDEEGKFLQLIARLRLATLFLLLCRPTIKFTT